MQYNNHRTINTEIDNLNNQYDMDINSSNDHANSYMSNTTSNWRQSEINKDEFNDKIFGKTLIHNNKRNKKYKRLQFSFTGHNFKDRNNLDSISKDIDKVAQKRYKQKLDKMMISTIFENYAATRKQNLMNGANMSQIDVKNIK